MSELSEIAGYFVAWCQSLQALPELDAYGDAVLIQSLRIENEGWERDDAITGSKE